MKSPRTSAARSLPALVSVLACLAVATVAAEDPARLDRLRAELPALVAERMVRGNLPGVSVALVQDGRVVYAQGFGNINLTYPDPVTPRSVFRVASLTKQFTAMALLARDPSRSSSSATRAIRSDSGSRPDRSRGSRRRSSSPAGAP